MTLSLPVETVYKKIVACGHLAEDLGAKILGLGAFTSVVGDAGKTIADRLDIPLLPHACERIRNTTPQSSLPWKARKRNVRNAFACGENLHGLHVAMVDDVMTSGATLDELARTLRRAGAQEISVWVVARTVRRSG